MITPKVKIAPSDFVKSLAPRNEDSQPADRIALGFDAVLAQLQELVSTLSDRVERSEAIIDRIEQALADLGIDADELLEDEASTEDSTDTEEAGAEDDPSSAEDSTDTSDAEPERGEVEPDRGNFD